MLLAKVAQMAEDYDDVYEYLVEVISIKVNIGEDFSKDEKEFISVGFRNYIGVLQSKIRVLDAIQTNKRYSKYERILPDLIYEKKIKLKEQCVTIANLLKNKAYKLASDNEAMCHFQKLIGDHYRFAYDALDITLYKMPNVVQMITNEQGVDVEMEIDKPDENALLMGLPKPEDPLEKEKEELDKERGIMKENALKAYSFGTHKADRGLITSHPTRLALLLNFMLFNYHIMEDRADAIKAGNRGILVAEKKMKHLNEEQKEEANDIIGIIKEHLTKWKEEENQPKPAGGEKKEEEEKK